MSSATKIIKANDLIALKEKMDEENLDILRLMRITKKSINLSRKDCFHFLYEYSKKFKNNPDYNKSYLEDVILQASSTNTLYVIEHIFNDPDFDKNKINFDYILEYSTNNYRIINFFNNNLDKSYFPSNFLYKSLLSLARKYTQQSIKVENLLSKNFRYVSNDLYKHLNTKRSNYYEYKAFGLMDIILKHDKKQEALIKYPLFSEFMNDEDLKKYMDLSIVQKIVNF